MTNPCPQCGGTGRQLVGDHYAGDAMTLVTTAGIVLALVGACLVILRIRREMRQ